MTRASRRIPIAIGVVLLAIQLVRPEKPGAGTAEHGPMTAHVETPADVESLLRDACHDCHSPETRWPWYAEIAPFSWMLVRHVRHGRADLDFLNWSTHPTREPTPRQRLRWICEETRSGEMPPWSYRLVHPDARLTDAEKDRLCAWAAVATEGLP